MAIAGEDLQSSPLNFGFIIRFVVTQIQLQPILFPLHNHVPSCKGNLPGWQPTQPLPDCDGCIPSFHPKRQLNEFPRHHCLPARLCSI